MRPVRAHPMLLAPLLIHHQSPLPQRHLPAGKDEDPREHLAVARPRPLDDDGHRDRESDLLQQQLSGQLQARVMRLLTFVQLQHDAWEAQVPAVQRGARQVHTVDIPELLRFQEQESEHAGGAGRRREAARRPAAIQRAGLPAVE